MKSRHTLSAPPLTPDAKMDRLVVGERVFDINTDGVAQAAPGHPM